MAEPLHEQVADGRVADAPSNNWVYRVLPHGLWPYAQLARWDRPIGWWLLLWPCWWSLALAFHHGQSSLPQSVSLEAGSFGAGMVMMFWFWLGAVMMRGAGCTYNDMVDVDIDIQVARTASRPIASKRVSKRAAALFLVLQLVLGFVSLLGLTLFNPLESNSFAFYLAVSSLIIVACYPFAKRVTDWPQLVLGLAFSWGALMGWAVVFNGLSPASMVLYGGCILWTIGYDTIYAHQDREDDALVGVRSTARLFGEKTQTALMVLYGGTVALLALAFWLSGSGLIAYGALLLGAGHMIWQIYSLDINNGERCLALFKSNSQWGWIIFIGLIADLFI